MTAINPSGWALCFAFLGALAPAVGRAVDAPRATAEREFTLRDYLGRSWRNEVVRFPVKDAALESARSGKGLVGPDGTPVPYQLTSGKTTKDAAIAFPADLMPFETRTFRFTTKPAKVATDLVLEETE